MELSPSYSSFKASLPSVAPNPSYLFLASCETSSPQSSQLHFFTRDGPARIINTILLTLENPFSIDAKRRTTYTVKKVCSPTSHRSPIPRYQRVLWRPCSRNLCCLPREIAASLCSSQADSLSQVGELIIRIEVQRSHTEQRFNFPILPSRLVPCQHLNSPRTLFCAYTAWGYTTSCL